MASLRKLRARHARVTSYHRRYTQHAIATQGHPYGMLGGSPARHRLWERIQYERYRRGLPSAWTGCISGCCNHSPAGYR